MASAAAAALLPQTVDRNLCATSARPTDRIRRWKLWFLAADWLKQSCFNADDVK
jgi:hypothetical protein